LQKLSVAHRASEKGGGGEMKQKFIRVSRKELEIREILRIVTRKLEEKAKERQDKEVRHE
jgi:hypothetical protein